MTKFEAGKTYKTRDGREARIYATDAGGDFPIHGAMKYGIAWVSQSWRVNGACDHSINGHPFDLLPEPCEFWINVYPNGGVATHRSESDAKKFRDDGRNVETIHVQEVVND